MTDIAKIRTGKVKGTMNSNNLSDYYYNHFQNVSLRSRLRKVPIQRIITEYHMQ